MKIKDVEKAVINFCANESISITNGFIDPAHLSKVEIFLDVLKASSKARAKFLRREPKSAGDILAGIKIGGRKLL